MCISKSHFEVKVLYRAACCLALLSSQAAFSQERVRILEGDEGEAYLMQAAQVQGKIVRVSLDKAELCFVDSGDCHAVLVGKTTPKGRFKVTLVATDLKGYGGDVIGFHWTADFTFALHRVWTERPAERRLERLASPIISDRIMTNGCINVSDSIYERLKQYVILEIE